jgi:hypothetical protein
MGKTIIRHSFKSRISNFLIIPLFVVILSACKIGSYYSSGNEQVSPEEATHFSDADREAYEGAYGQMFPGVTPQGSGRSADIAKMASAMIGFKNCAAGLSGGIKCAVQASTILRAAGVNVWDASVNGLVSKLRAQGWRDGACGPGAVFHTAQASSSGRHVGVIGQDGRVVHNGGIGGTCGQLGTKNYPSWFSRGKCLVAPT